MAAFIAFLLVAAIWVLAIGGWIANIVKLVHHVGVFGILELVRIIGIFVAPLGAVLGFVN